jgi:hypothetical protein
MFRFDHQSHLSKIERCPSLLFPFRFAVVGNFLRGIGALKLVGNIFS